MHYPLLLTLMTQLTLQNVSANEIEMGKKIVMEGNQNGGLPCLTCHLENGEGMQEHGFPQLAGLNANYFIKQIKDYQSGLRIHDVMNPIAKALSDEDIKNVAAYFSSLPPVPKPEKSPASEKWNEGKWIAERGLWDRKIPACFSCHGQGGVGVGENFPPLINQGKVYLKNALQSFQRGTRKNDPQMLMRSIAGKLTKKETDAVAFYLSSLPDTTSQGAAQWSVSIQTAPVKTQYFQPPQEKDIPDNEFGKLVRQGRDIFIDTQTYAKPYVGNSLNCVNCHLDAGRLPDSAPLWGAYGMYPAYRAKTKNVDTIENRMQGCFMYSMNGKAPAVDSPEMKALVVYMYWMSTGVPVGKGLPGRVYPVLKDPPRPPSWEAGQLVFEKNCMVCHGKNGEGQYINGQAVFPPLWGEKSYNWGAGMHRINTAAGFIKANMPLSQGGQLSDQDAWDVAFFINSHERPKDPRRTGTLEEAAKKYHDENCSYGKEIHGVKLGL